MTSPFPIPGPFDLDAATTQIGAAVGGVIELTFRPSGEVPTPEATKSVWDAMLGALQAGSSACAEVKRIRGALTDFRDSHRPRPHADPTAPGAICDGCSVHGALVNWPCAPWQFAERLLASKGA